MRLNICSKPYMYMAETNLDLVRAPPQATCRHTAVMDEKWTTDVTRDTAKEDIV